MDESRNTLGTILTICGVWTIKTGNQPQVIIGLGMLAIGIYCLWPWIRSKFN
jgi:hypothetical protein